MERKIGETFEYEGKKLKVVETARNLCFDCYFFDGVSCQKSGRECGYCDQGKRSDYRPVIFVEAKDEIRRELNLCEILKNCPIGTKFWSPLLGEVELSSIHGSSVSVRYYTGSIWDVNSDGTTTLGGVTSPEIILFPSREQRDWTKVKYEPKKERFDPKALEPFDKVLVRSEKVFNWNCSLFSNIDDSSSKYPFTCLGLGYKYCIPYNNDTKHLIGTTNEAPEFYRYWEE